jgi:hypothetical protein
MRRSPWQLQRRRGGRRGDGTRRGGRRAKERREGGPTLQTEGSTEMRIQICISRAIYTCSGEERVRCWNACGKSAAKTRVWESRRVISSWARVDSTCPVGARASDRRRVPVPSMGQLGWGPLWHTDRQKRDVCAHGRRLDCDSPSWESAVHVHAAVFRHAHSRIAMSEFCLGSKGRRRLGDAVHHGPPLVVWPAWLCDEGGRQARRRASQT